MVSPGFIEVDMFPPEVDNPDHPEAARFRELLQRVATDYGCSLLSFDVDHGTVIFSFDSEELTAEILRILQDEQ